MSLTVQMQHFISINKIKSSSQEQQEAGAQQSVSELHQADLLNAHVCQTAEAPSPATAVPSCANGPAGPCRSNLFLLTAVQAGSSLSAPHAGGSHGCLFRAKVVATPAHASCKLISAGTPRIMHGGTETLYWKGLVQEIRSRPRWEGPGHRFGGGKKKTPDNHVKGFQKRKG